MFSQAGWNKCQLMLHLNVSVAVFLTILESPGSTCISPVWLERVSYFSLSLSVGPSVTVALFERSDGSYIGHGGTGLVSSMCNLAM